MDKLLYGVAYYDEYMPYDRLDKDIEMMKEAGINTIRIAESTWSTLEPQAGEFDFSHIDRVIRAAEKSDLNVIVGTPTYAVPTWLVKEAPTVLAVTENGQNKYGPRQNMDITNKTYLFYAERMIRKLIAHVKNSKAVIGYQADNETKHYNTAGKNVQIQFRKHLKKKFKSLKELNEAFGLDYWSNRINAWEDFPDVRETINASLKSAFEEFRRKLVTDFLGWQVDLINEYKREDQFVTQNFDFDWRGYSYGMQPDVNHFKAAETFDVVGVDIYHPSQNELTGTEISLGGDIVRSLKQDNYLVLETEAQAFANWVPYPGQLRLQAFSHLASGANMVAYWHWHSIHNSFETYWKGLLSHDFEPNPTYNEAKTVGKDFERLSDKLVDLKKDNQIAFLVSNNALTALNSFKPFAEDIDYNDLLRQFYDPLYEMNFECDFIYPGTEDLANYKAIIVPPLYAAKGELLEKLNEFTKNGGHLIYAFRSGFSDENVKVRTVKQPGIISKSCGVTYSQFVDAESVKIKSKELTVENKNSSLKGWLELLTPAPKTEALASYDHQYWGEYAAITHNNYGKGTATYLGCYPEKEVIKEVYRKVFKKAELWSKEQDISFPLITKKGVNKEGKTIRYYFNYSAEKITFNYPHQRGKELLNGKDIKTDSELKLNDWGFVIIEEK